MKASSEGALVIQFTSLLFTAYCLPLAAYRLLPTVFCLLPSAFYLLVRDDVYRLLLLGAQRHLGASLVTGVGG